MTGRPKLYLSIPVGRTVTGHEVRAVKVGRFGRWRLWMQLRVGRTRFRTGTPSSWLTLTGATEAARRNGVRP